MKKSLIWSRFRLIAWLMGNRQAKKERARRQSRIRSRAFERLEERDLFAVVVDANTANINPDVAAIVITGSGFDPIVSNNTVTFNNSAVGTVVSASPTQLTVQFSTAPDDAGSLTAIVATLTENSGSAVQVATVVPKVTASLSNLAANASTSRLMVTASMRRLATTCSPSPMERRVLSRPRPIPHLPLISPLHLLQQAH